MSLPFALTQLNYCPTQFYQRKKTPQQEVLPPLQSIPLSLTPLTPVKKSSIADNLQKMWELETTHTDTQPNLKRPRY
jgi:hypothetical protein